MSAFVCGYVVVRAVSATDQRQKLMAFRDLASGRGLRIRYGTGTALPSIVSTILSKAVSGIPRDAICFLIATDDLPDVSDGVVDVDDDLVGTSISVRDAVVRRLATVEQVITAGFEAGLIVELTLVVSLGVDDSYPVVVVTPDEVSGAIADAYEREGQVPSLCVVVQPRSGDGQSRLGGTNDGCTVEEGAGDDR